MRSIFSTAAVLAISAAVSPAFGQACDPPGAAAAAGATTQAVIGAQITALGVIIQQAAGQISGHVDNVNVGVGHVMDAGSAERQRQTRQQSEAQATNHFAPSGTSCQAATGSLGMAAANVNTTKTARTIAQTRQQYAGVGSGSPQSAQQRLATAFNQRLSQYASARDQPAGKGTGAMPDTDLTVGTTILSYATYPDAQHTQAAQDATLRLVQPVPLPDFPVGTVNTPAGKAAYMADLGDRSVSLLTHYMVDGRVAERTPNPSDQSSSWATAILGSANIPTADPIPAQLSLHQLLDVDIERRYMNPQWHLALQQMEPAELQREQVRMAALDLQLRWMSYQRQEEANLALAALLSRVQRVTAAGQGSGAAIPVSAPTGGQTN